MNIYTSLNSLIEYIEKHLEEKIQYKELAKILCVNEYTMQRIFSLICNVTLADYIRKRRLSNAGFDVYKNDDKIIDIALKYQYENATSFSRAFEKFHGIKPSQVKSNPEKLKIYTKFIFNETVPKHDNIEYSIIYRPQMILYGISQKTSVDNISEDAPKHFSKVEQLYGRPSYGMTVYEDRFLSTSLEYWVLYNEYKENLKEYIIPAGKWLLFNIPSQEAIDIQNVANQFYLDILPSSKYNLKPIPELEHYHDGVTDFLVPIED